LLYVITPVVIIANVLGVAAWHESCMFNPWATSSTYCFVAASLDEFGVPKFWILKLIEQISEKSS
jgi:hypothetical protein